MAIIDDVTTQMKEAMRAKEKVRLGALRSIRAAFIEALKADGSETLPDEKSITIIRRLEKQRKESIDAFEKGGRPEMAEAEKAELAIIQEFLPQLADASQTREWVVAAIASTGATEKKDMGKVMGALMKDHRADLDGNIAKGIVQELLS